MKILDFHLHDFCRISWASRGLQQTWESPIADLSTLCGAQLPGIWTDLYCARLFKVYPHELNRFSAGLRKHWLSKNDLAIQTLETDIAYAKNVVPHLDDDDRKITVLAGDTRSVEKLQEKLTVFAEQPEFVGNQQQLNEKQLTELYRLLGWPRCCGKSMSDLQASLSERQAGATRDPVWNMVCGDVNSGEQSHVVEVKGHFATNLMMQPIGLGLLQHRPCNPSCARSIELGSEVLARLSMEFKEQAKNLREILSWSYAWSSLHGIVEVKSPIFKMIHNGQALAEKIEVHWSGDTQPRTGIKGLSFPYRKPAKLIFSDSASFARGLANPIK